MKRQFTKEQDLLEDSFRLAVNIYNSGFRPDVIVGLWRGGSTVGIYVQECLQYLGVATRHIAARTSYEGVESYQRMVEAESRIRVHGLQYLYETLNHDDKLLIVDDVFASGKNVAAVIDKLQSKTKRNMPEDVRIATLWYRPDEQPKAGRPDYFLTETQDWLVLPYELSGFSLSEIYENKPFLKEIIEDLREQLPQGMQFPS
ncbi:MAG: hypoxanthine phosphoribosyltransferase [Proteobacteria bacterium]|nr:hypoxanthine phosphoribosyltransferase [Pseudomonadota bacterium]